MDVQSCLISAGLVCVMTSPAAAEPMADATAATAAYKATDFAKAFQLVQPLANQGNSRAQFDLAGLYYAGKGAPHDEAQAFAWYKKSAEQGFAPAEKALGERYMEGAGVARDNAQALAWIRKAADQHYGPAELEMGLVAFVAAGDDDKAQAAAKTDSEAWQRKAAEDGDLQAMLMIAMELRLQDDSSAHAEEALKWLHKAAYLGSVQAMEQIANACAHGSGVKEDHVEAARWYVMAAEHGSASAATQLAMLNGAAFGQHGDPVKGHMWADISKVRLEAKSQQAHGQLADALTKMNASLEELTESMAGDATPAQLAEAQKAADAWLAQHPVPPHAKEDTEEDAWIPPI